MKIGIDLRALMEGKTTGVEVYVINLLHTLFRIDQKNQYVLFANSLRDISQRTKLFSYPNVIYKIYHLPNKLLNLWQKVFALPKIDRLLGGIDLFFSPHWRIASLSNKVPLVITFHDLSYEVMPDFFTVRQRLWHKFMNYRHAAQNATRLIAVSESTKSDLVTIYGVQESKISVIHPGLAPSARPEIIPNLPEKFFLSFSTFEPRKNLESVLEAYEEYYSQSSVKSALVLAGSSGWKTKLEVPPYLKNAVTIFNNVTEAQKTYLYHRAYALLFLSFYEGFGFPILEAASFGLPVISSFATSLSEIGNSFALLVNPFRSSQAASAMLALEEEPGFYEELRISGQEAASRYSWKNSAKRHLELFKSL